MATPETEQNVAAAPASGEQTPPPALEAEGSTQAAAAEMALNSGGGDAPDTGRIDPSLPSFKEETYVVADLKESEKMALQELKAKIEEEIKSRSSGPVKEQETVKESEAVKDAELVSGVESMEEGNKDEALEASAVAKETVAAEDASAATSAEASRILPQSDSPGMESEEVSKIIVEESKAPAEAITESTPTDSITPPTAPNPEATATFSAENEATAGVDAVTDEGLSLWGVPLLHTKDDPRTDVILLKFLRARDSKVNDAYTMLRDTILWRKKFGADEILEEDFGADFGEVSYLQGVDKQGHPVSYNIFGALNDKDLYQKAFGDQTKTERFMRWRIQLLEKSIQLLNFNPGNATALVQVIDLKNSPWPAKKELRLFINQALSLLQDNYPELVVKNVLINVPWYFTALYSVISPFLTQRTKSKFVLVGGGKVTESLFKLISPEQVPVRYGGLSRLNDGEFEHAVAPIMDLVVKAGEKQTVEFEIPVIGGTVVWDLAVVGWDISYGAEFVPNVEGGYTTVIEKTKKIITSEEPVRNTFQALQAGKIVLIIDNTSSRKKKAAVYRYLVKNPSEVTEVAS